MDRQLLLRQVRELIELERGFGVEFVVRKPAGPAATLPAGAARAAVPALPSVALPLAVLPPAAPLVIAAPVARAAPPAHSPAPRDASPSAPPAMPISRPPAVAGASAPAAPATSTDADDALAGIARAIAICTACGLCTTRRTTVPGEGAPRPQLVFIGEGPGAEEDAQGRPFVGPAGQLLDKMIIAMGLARQEVFITNVVKCRPPGNRNPEPIEVLACSGFLEQQLASLAPQVICTLGNVPLRALFGAEQPGITRSHGQILSWRGITVIPTFHPSYLLRNEQAKKPAWEDLQVVLRTLGRTAPRRGGATS